MSSWLLASPSNTDKLDNNRLKLNNPPDYIVVESQVFIWSRRAVVVYWVAESRHLTHRVATTNGTVCVCGRASISKRRESKSRPAISKSSRYSTRTVVRFCLLFLLIFFFLVTTLVVPSFFEASLLYFSRKDEPPVDASLLIFLLVFLVENLVLVLDDGRPSREETERKSSTSASSFLL